MRRREFTPNQYDEIIARATDATGVIRCERCSLALKRGEYEVDHIIPEGLRPEADKTRRLVLADGQLLGTKCCHRGENGKTRADIGQIAKMKRQRAKHLGTKAPSRRPMPGSRNTPFKIPFNAPPERRS